MSERVDETTVDQDDEKDWDDRVDGDDEVRVPQKKRPSKSRIVFQDEDDEYLGQDRSFTAEMVDMYEESIKNLEEGEIVRGRVLSVDDKDVLVDIGFKSEGIIPASEFTDASSIKVGDEIEVYLEKMENQDGLIVLSKQRADFVKVWDRVKEAAEKGEVVEGRLLRKIKGASSLTCSASRRSSPAARSRSARCRTSTLFWGRRSASRSSS